MSSGCHAGHFAGFAARQPGRRYTRDVASPARERPGAGLSAGRHGNDVVRVLAGDLLGRDDDARRAVRNGRAVEKAERIGDDRVRPVIAQEVELVAPVRDRQASLLGARRPLLHDVPQRGVELRSGVALAVLVILDGDVHQVLPRGAVPRHVGRGHGRVQAGEGEGSLVDLERHVAGSCQVVLDLLVRRVGHPLDAPGQDHVVHPGGDGHDRLPESESAAGAGPLDPRRRARRQPEPVSDDVSHVPLPLEQVADEVADVQGLDVGGVHALVNRVHRVQVSLGHQVAARLVRVRAEVRHGAAHDGYPAPQLPFLLLDHSYSPALSALATCSKSLLPLREKARACPGPDPGMRGLVPILPPSPQSSSVKGEEVREHPLTGRSSNRSPRRP